MILLLDNYDSFTYNLVDYLAQLGAETIVLRNDTPLAEIQQYNYQGMVLSPGPATPRQAGVLMELIAYYHTSLPILGVCLGHQAIGEFFGATLTKAHLPMHGKVSTIKCLQQDAILEEIPNRFKVVRYHSLLLQNLPPTLIPLATTNDEQEELMLMKHQSLPIYGVQYHPEAILTEYGLQLLKNWLLML